MPLGTPLSQEGEGRDFDHPVCSKRLTADHVESVSKFNANSTKVHRQEARESSQASRLQEIKPKSMHHQECLSADHEETPSSPLQQKKNTGVTSPEQRNSFSPRAADLAEGRDLFLGPYLIRSQITK